MEADTEQILIHMIHYPVMTLGPGRRVGVWLRGCSIRCAGCISEELWSFDPRYARGVKSVADEVCDFFKGSTPADGVTISGGEPFDQPESLMALLRLLRFGGVCDILLYTGYEISRILPRNKGNKQLPRLATAVIDGPFKLDLETEAAWKGSSNQTLTLFDPNYEERYVEWSRTMKGTIQIAHSGGRVVYIGIPRQADVSRIRERITLKIEETTEFQ